MLISLGGKLTSVELVATRPFVVAILFVSNINLLADRGGRGGKKMFTPGKLMDALEWGNCGVLLIGTACCGCECCCW